MKEFKGTREAFAQALSELTEKDNDVVFVSSDSLKAMRAVPYSESFPSNYIEVGIAEQGAVAVGAGLASCGVKPYIATYAGFLTMRACEQMRTFVAYPNLNVKFIGVNAGLYGGEREGTTHQFYEDVSILSAIPNFTILTPADAAQTYWAVKAAYEIDGPVYVRAGSGREIDIYDKETPFSMDGIRILKDYGRENIIFASGFIMKRVLDAAELLKEEGISVTVADINIINGKNSKEIINVIKSGKRLFTIEDQNIHGGLGSYISGLVTENDPKPMYKFGLTTFGESGIADDLVDKYGFSKESICDFVKSKM